MDWMTIILKLGIAALTAAIAGTGFYLAGWNQGVRDAICRVTRIRYIQIGDRVIRCTFEEIPHKKEGI